MRRFGVVLATSLMGCAVQLRAPQPDLPDRTPMRPAPQLSHLAAVARIPHATLARLAQAHLNQGQSGTEAAAMLQATWQVTRDGPVAVHGDERGRLCFVTPFKGNVEVAALGQRLQRDLRGKLSACARPELDSGAALHMRDADARVLIDRSAIGGPVAFVLDAIVTKLQAVAGEAALTKLREWVLPTWDALGPLQTMLQTPIALPDGSCVKLRPQSVRVTQPTIDPSALRMGASIAALPTAEQPCVREAQLPDSGRLLASVADNLDSPKTFLLLPVALAIENLRKPMQDEMERIGVLKTDQGWVKVTGIRLSTAKGSLLVHAAIVGEVQDKFLFIPIRRPLSGEILLWGTPEVGRDGIQLTKLEMELHTDDRLVALGAALKHSQLVDVVSKYAKIPRDRIDVMARKALDDISQGIYVGKEKLPARISTDQLQIESVTAAGQRLEVLVRFVGQVVIGDTAQR